MGEQETDIEGRVALLEEQVRRMATLLAVLGAALADQAGDILERSTAAL